MRNERQSMPAGDWTRERVLQGIQEIVGEHLGRSPADLRETHDLLHDLGCDSLDTTEIVMEIEEQFDLSIPDDAAQEIRTIGQAADGVLRILQQPQTAGH